jgi:hypothetical protein
MLLDCREIFLSIHKLHRCLRIRAKDFQWEFLRIRAKDFQWEFMKEGESQQQSTILPKEKVAVTVLRWTKYSSLLELYIYIYSKVF